MNTIRLMITALMAAGAIACFAEPAASPPGNAAKPEAAKPEDGPRRPRMEQRSREGRPARPEGERHLGVARDVCVRPHPEPAHFIGPAQQPGELLVEG